MMIKYIQADNYPKQIFLKVNKMIKTSTIIDVPFYDVDPMNIVWHGNYIKYLEQARCDMFAKIGYTYTDMYNDGIMYPIAKMEFKFIRPSTFGDKLRIECELKEIEPALNINYTIYNNTTGEKIFKAKSMQICVDKNTRESTYQEPVKLKEKIKQYETSL